MFYPFQCLCVGDELNLAKRLIANDISGLVQFARYIRAPIALRYGTSGPSISSFSSCGWKGSVLILI